MTRLGNDTGKESGICITKEMINSELGPQEEKGQIKATPNYSGSLKKKTIRTIYFVQPLWVVLKKTAEPLQPGGTLTSASPVQVILLPLPKRNGVHFDSYMLCVYFNWILVSSEYLILAYFLLSGFSAENICTEKVFNF